MTGRARILYTIDVRSVPGQPFSRETFSRLEDAEDFIAQVERETPDFARELRIEERLADSLRQSQMRPSSELRKVA